MEEPERLLLTNCYFYVHRLKTSSGNGDFQELVAVSPTLRAIASKLSDARRSYMNLFFGRRNLSEVSRDEVLAGASAYLALLCGLKPSLASNAGAAGSGMYEGAESSGTPSSLPDLGGVIKFSWRNVLGAAVDVQLNDAAYEVASVLLNTGIWLLGYSDYLVSNPGAESADDKLKLAHDSLVKAAGVFERAGEVMKLLPPGWSRRPLELHDDMLNAFRCQSIAQAHEVTISTGTRRGTSAMVLSRLASGVVDQYAAALAALNTVDAPVENRVSKWRQYVTFKLDAYKAYARDQQAVALMGGQSAEACGEAVACVNAAKPLSDKAFNEATRYARLPPVKAEDQHAVAFAKQLTAIVDEDHRKFNLENDMVYYQRAPATPPALPAATLISKPQEFALPALDPAWNAIQASSIDAGVVTARQQQVASELETASSVEVRVAPKAKPKDGPCRVA